jgi:hypothetical protein
VARVETSPGPEPDGGGPPGPAPAAGETDGTAPVAGEVEPAGAVEREPPEGRDPLRFNHWMKRSAAGAVLSGMTLGLREALEPTKKTPAFVIEASGLPDDPDNPIDLRFDPDNPADTVAIIRAPRTAEGPTPPPED